MQAQVIYDLLTLKSLYKKKRSARKNIIKKKVGEKNAGQWFE